MVRQNEEAVVGGIGHTITAPSSAATFTAFFGTYYQLTTAVAPATLSSTRRTVARALSSR